MRVLVTTLGRSHFIQVATSLVRRGLDVILFQGWIVSEPQKSYLLKIASKIIGRKSLIYGFEKRSTPELSNRMVGDFISECVDTIAKMLTYKIGKKTWNFAVKLGFWCHGFRTRRLLRKGNFDVFHCKSGLGAGGAISQAKALGIPVLVDHSAGAPQFVVEKAENDSWGRWSFWWTVQEDCDNADLLMVDCDWVRETFLMYGYPKEKIRVVYMGLDEKFNGLKDWSKDNVDSIGKTPDNPLRIVFTGPFAPHKGNEDFIEAIAQLQMSNYYIEVDVFGSVVISAEIKLKFKDVISFIRFHGHVSQDEMCEALKKSHLYLFPSLSEGCAKSAYEAMSMGLCVVCTKETGLPLTDGVNGYLVRSKCPRDISIKIDELLRSPEKIKQAGINGTLEMKKHTWSRYAAEVESVYEELRGLRK